MPQSSSKSNFIPLATMFLLFFVVAFVTGLNAPIGPALKQQFKGLGFSENLISQAGTFAFFAAYGFMGIPSSWLIKRFGYKNTTFIALAIAIIGSLLFLYTCLNPNFFLYLFATFIIGCSITILQVVINPFITALGPEKTAASRLNFGGAINSIGATLAPIIGGTIIGNAVNVSLADAKPIYITVIGLLIIVALILYFVYLPPIHTIDTASEKSDSKYSAWSFRHLLLGTLGIFCYVGVEVGVANITYMYLSSSPAGTPPGIGLEGAIAGTFIGMYWLLALVGRLIGGVLGQRISARILLSTAASMAIILLFLGISMGQSRLIEITAIDVGNNFETVRAKIPVSALLFILVGFCTSVGWPCTFSLAVQGLGKYTNQGSGMLVFMVIGGAILPPLQGYIADASHNFLSSYWLPIIGWLYILYYALIGSKNINKDIPV